MDYSKTYARWIEGFTKDQFDDFIKVFIKDYWNVDTVSITDGSGDGGLDVKVFKNRKGRKLPLQITIDKNTIPKLKKDLIKIEELISKFDYEDKFYFFYSKGIPEKKVLELKHFALKEYEIELEIFDNKLIGSFTDKINFSSTREKLKEILNLYAKDEESYFDENQKLYFDYLSYADEAKELKEKFISSYILNTLYVCNGKGLSIENLKNKIKGEFEVTDSGLYFDRIIQNLLSVNKIKKNENDLILDEEEFVKIKTIKENSELLETEFISKLQSLILNSDNKVEIRIVINKLKSIYESQKQLSIDEISEEISDKDDECIKDFISYIKKSFSNDEIAKKFISEVFKLCSLNNFLEITSVGKIYKKLMNNPEFKAYTNRVNKEIFIDTPVLIYLLLIFKEPDSEYDNYYYKTAKKLFDLINSDENYGTYNTTQYYIYELADYLKGAINLIPLDKLNVFKNLGGSNNEFYTFYEYLKNEENLELSFQEFIESFGIIISEAEKQNTYISQVLFNIFKVNKIYIDDVEAFDKNHNTKKDFEIIEKQFIDIYTENKISRNRRSLRFDSLLIQHLCNNFEPKDDPTLITWDKSFKIFRNAYLPKNPNSDYWHIFTPGNFLDHISLIGFKINGDSISNEILAMIETDFEVVKKVRKLADVLSSIIDLKSEVGINLSVGLAKIRRDYIYQINKTTDENTIDENNRQPIDNLVEDLINYYDNKVGEYNFTDFTETLKLEENMNLFLKLVDSESKFYSENSKYNLDYKKEFDIVIKNHITN